MLSRSLLVLIMVSLLSSCGAMFGTRKQKVMINSNVNNARIHLDGIEIGVTPKQIELLTDAYPVIMIKKEGYKDVYLTPDKIFRFSPNNVDTKWCAISLIIPIVGPLVDLATESCWIGYKPNYFIALNKI